jgi:pseudouridine-5'-phosphate glycosidase
MEKDLFIIQAEVEDSLHNRTPVLALESTIIAHGMPYPENLSFAEKMLQTAHENGVTPAIVAILDGKIHLGLNQNELDRIAHADMVEKISRRDISYALAFQKTGATTVSATMYLSHAFNIPVFATGGIGGVHRNSSETMDISQDLTTLSQTPQVVVSAGAKAILDLPKTLEQLETYGVPVLGYGVHRFPAFYSRSSLLELRYSVNTPEAIAHWFIHHQKSGLKSALLVANPVPEKDEIPESEISAYIDQAVQEAEKKTITGRNLTPFLLQRIVELSGGASLKANISLALNNVLLGAQIAKAIRVLRS